ERQQTGGALLESFGNAPSELPSIERLVSAIALHHAQVRALDLLVSGEAISAFEALAAPANAGAIARLTGIDDLVITRAALGATHSVKALNNTPRVVASTIFNAWNCCCSAHAATALRGALFFGFLSANSKPTFPFSNLRCAENGRPFLETNFGRRSVLPVVISFCTCSFGISRCRMFLLIRNVQVFSLATAFSQA